MRTLSALHSSAGTLRGIPQVVSTVATTRPNTWNNFYCVVSIPQAVGTFTPSFSFSPLFGQGLEMCGPHRHFAPLLPRTLRRIPQAVSTVATLNNRGIYNVTVIDTVSIPQAVSTVATAKLIRKLVKQILVSIPQAVSTVATSI